MRTNGQKDKTKLIVSPRNFAKAPNKRRRSVPSTGFNPGIPAIKRRHAYISDLRNNGMGSQDQQPEVDVTSDHFIKQSTDNKPTGRLRIQPDSEEPTNRMTSDCIQEETHSNLHV